MSNRKKTEDFIISCIEYMLPGAGNKEIYQQKFKDMNDKEFGEFIDRLEDGREHLVMLAPVMSGRELSIERNFKLAEKLGHEFLQNIWVKQEGKATFLTPIKYLAVDLPLRRASQVLTKKIKIPEHSKTLDKLTGQPTGPSKGAKISYPELQVLMAMGLENTATEFLKYRGGDIGGYRAMRTMLSKYGTARQETLKPYSTGAESSKTLNTFLTTAHISNNM